MVLHNSLNLDATQMKKYIVPGTNISCEAFQNQTSGFSAGFGINLISSKIYGNITGVLKKATSVNLQKTNVAVDQVVEGTFDNFLSNVNTNSEYAKAMLSPNCYVITKVVKLGAYQLRSTVIVMILLELQPMYL
jgi:hypothetical protein